MLGIRPGTAWAVEAPGLVHAQEGRRSLDRYALLDEMFAQRLQGAPSTGGLLVRAYALGRGHDPAPDQMS